MSNASRNYRQWENARDKIFRFVASISAMAFFMLICTILENNRETPCKHEHNISLDSICNQVAQEKVPKMDITKYGRTQIDSLRWKIDSLGVREQILQQALSKIETLMEERQSDIRQETNNIINKFNGNISWWLLLLGVICGFAPMVLTYLNHKNDNEYIKLLNSNYKEVLEELNIKKKELEELAKKLENEEKMRSEKMEEEERLLKLMHSFVYTTSITRKAKFQQSQFRDCIADRLLRNILLNSIECINKQGIENDQMTIFYWFMATSESIELIMPFQKERTKMRRMNDILNKLKELQRCIYTNGSLPSQQIGEINKSMNDFCNIFVK